MRDASIISHIWRTNLILVVTHKKGFDLDSVVNEMSVETDLVIYLASLYAKNTFPSLFFITC